MLDGLFIDGSSRLNKCACRRVPVACVGSTESLGYSLGRKGGQHTEALIWKPHGAQSKHNIDRRCGTFIRPYWLVVDGEHSIDRFPAHWALSPWRTDTPRTFPFISYPPEPSFCFLIFFSLDAVYVEERCLGDRRITSNYSANNTDT